jgi:hypothetical protein
MGNRALPATLQNENIYLLDIVRLRADRIRAANTLLHHRVIPLSCCPLGW